MQFLTIFRKEKQKEGKGYLGIRGMIERDKNRIFEHIVYTEEKYEKMMKERAE